MLRKLTLILVLLGFVAGAYIAITALNLPNVRAALTEGIKPTQTTQLLANDGETVIMSQGKYFHKPLSIKEMSPVLIESLVATEDRRFYHHFGVDVVGLSRAIWINTTKGGLHEGGSTLTQQLAKNVFLTNERSLQRKIKEGLLALKLESQLSKDEILELYLNNVYFGEGAYGVGAASEIYFGKQASNLSVTEGALLAGLPQAPSRFNPYENPALAMKRRNEVLWNLVEVGKIKKDDFLKLREKPIRLNPNGRKLAASDKAPYFNRYVIEQAKDALGLDDQTFWSQGIKIYTTIDVNAQEIATQEVSNQMLAAGRSGKNRQAALVSINSDGAIIAYVGGKNFSESQYDVASQASRQAGSLFKVFVYTTAIAQGMTPQTVYVDAPVTIDNWEPKNYDKTHHGYMSLAKALVISNNVVAAKVARDVGISNVINTAHQMGVTSQFSPLPAVALGAGGVNLLEMTTAFSTLANDGYLVEPYGIAKIVDKNGSILFEHIPRRRRALDKVNRDTIVAMLKGVVAHGTGKAAALSRFPVAGKTGTSDDYRDAWFIGFTPDITTGVWVGNLDNSKMPGIAGGSIPARIWRAVMGPITRKLPRSNFNVSAALAISERDFFDYNIDNLSATDQDSTPVETTRIEDAFDEETLEGLTPEGETSGTGETTDGSQGAPPTQDGGTEPVNTDEAPAVETVQ